MFSTLSMYKQKNNSAHFCMNRSYSVRSCCCCCCFYIYR